MRRAVVAVGVDNGGTWIRLKGLNAQGHCVWSLRKPSPPVDRLPAFLGKHLMRFKGHLDGLAVGSRGVWKWGKRRSVRRALRSLAKRIVVMSDVEAAWLAAFGTIHAPCTVHRDMMGFRRARSTEHGARSTGIIVISGTGSIAYGRTSDGRFARAGGLGPEKGDEGSGYWIGKEWLTRNPSPHVGWERARFAGGEGARAVRRVAALTPRVIHKAKMGDPIAHAIISEAQSSLCDLVVQICEALKMKKVVPLSHSGSILEDKWFRTGFLKSLTKKGVRYHLIDKKMDPAVAPLTHTLSPLRGARGKLDRSRGV